MTDEHFATLASLEPRLGSLLEEARSRRSRWRSRRASQKLFDDQFRPRLAHLVGPGRYGGGPLLTSGQAFAVASQTIRDALINGG